MCARCRQSILRWSKLRTGYPSGSDAQSPPGQKDHGQSRPPATWPSLRAERWSAEARPEGVELGRRDSPALRSAPAHGVGSSAPAALKAAPRPTSLASLCSAQARSSFLVSRRRVQACGSVAIAAAAAAAAAAVPRHDERLQQRGARGALHPRVPSLPQ